MKEMSTPIDPQNPGQVFACFGIAELCGRMAADSSFSFDLSFGDERFLLRGPFEEAMRSLLSDQTRLEVIPKANAGNNDPDYADPVLLSLPGFDPIRLNWWFRPGEIQTIPLLKLWAGQRDSRQIFLGFFSDCRTLAKRCDLELSHWQEWRSDRPNLGVDPSMAWTARDSGHSLDASKEHSPNHPMVELLASIGLLWSRLMSPRNKLEYFLWCRPLTLPSARLASAGLLPLVGNRYRVGFDLRGKNKNLQYAECL